MVITKTSVGHKMNATGNPPFSHVSSLGPPVNGTADADYDSEGAMKFIVATVLVYSIFGVFCTILIRIKRRKGKSHEAMLHDEAISRYIKKSKSIRLEDHKLKLTIECSKYTDQIRRFEEKMKLQNLERELSSADFAETSFSLSKKKGGKRKARRKSSGMGAVGKMGMSLFFIGDRRPEEVSMLGAVSSDKLDSVSVVTAGTVSECMEPASGACSVSTRSFTVGDDTSTASVGDRTSATSVRVEPSVEQAATHNRPVDGSLIQVTVEDYSNKTSGLVRVDRGGGTARPSATFPSLETTF